MANSRVLVVATVMLVSLAAGVAVLGASGDDPEPYAPRIDPAAFTTVVDNPWFPLLPGTRWVYEGRSDEGLERKVVEVTAETRVVMGVPCVVVKDTVFLDGELYEDTVDWFAQDRFGNVWNFGEETRKRTDDGGFTPAGSWEAGVDGALPGTVMPGLPRPGASYRQEYLPGEAEDMARILRIEERLAVRAGAFDRVVTTRDWSPLDPDAVEHKHYALGVGLIREEAVQGDEYEMELVEVNRK